MKKKLNFFVSHSSCHYWLLQDAMNKIQKKWFKWHIIAKMIDNQILSKKQIYDCLTYDVRSHGELKDRLIGNDPSKSEEINSIFAQYGF